MSFFSLFSLSFLFFFFNDTATTEIYTLSLHDALPICDYTHSFVKLARLEIQCKLARERLEAHAAAFHKDVFSIGKRSEEHTSELQSLAYLVCRLLLEKKKKKKIKCRLMTMIIICRLRS